ncbi:MULTISPECIES: hypothetical protein [Flavobacteriaceae]|uniref:Uncharacterized protein n=2 Tax=Flavobacteriaceae TaxID=49546 RepID=A0A4Y8AXL2_9FLAO|nr:MULTISPECIES: hypothetical protein [Flavobacteriaceae]TEW76764.1 hypothetical protein E2488_02640 [Gramella jeungdoensis]GGK50211.1 hypothetical protein GCM10007963_18240 [Lutibacter litoralis]
MKTASVKELKTELKDCSNSELVELVLRLSKFKKENKELLTYLLYMASDEDAYISGIKIEVEQLFKEINTSSYYFMRKSIRKILRIVKTYIRYSKKKETEVELLLYFCKQLKGLRPLIVRNTTLKNLFERQVLSIEKMVSTLHEDLQYDFAVELQKLKN